MSADSVAHGGARVSVGARLRRRLLGIADDETTCAKRGFTATDPAARARLEHVGATFLRGYHLALGEGEPRLLAAQLDKVELEFRGFAFEGAAMALALLDALWPWGARRWDAFVASAGDPHRYMAHVGAGWAFARLPWLTQRTLTQRDPLLGWLGVDGFGFHEGYFHHPQSIGRQQRSARLSGYALRVFDQGLGRSMWFVYGADVGRIPQVIGGFAPDRQGDLWSGVGLACCYAGKATPEALVALRAAAGAHRGALGQGAAFAAKTRQRAGNLLAYTDAACQVLCGCAADAAAALTDRALAGLPFHTDVEAYELWRQRISAALTQAEAL